MQQHIRKNLMALAIASALGGASGLASAAGFALIEQSASGMGNAFAGTAASAEDASTVYFNPAGMSLLPGAQAVVSGHAVSVSARFKNASSSIPPFMTLIGRPPGGDGGDAGSVAFIPNAYFSMPVNESWSIGLGVNVPFGLKTEYDNDWIGRFQGIKSELTTFNINPSVAYKINDSVSVGAGLNYQHADAELTNAVVLAPPFIPGAFPAEGRTKLSANDDGWGWNVGTIYQVTPATRIGASYRSKIKYTLEGDVTTTDGTGAVVTTNLGGLTVSGPSKADITFPDMYSLSGVHRLNDQWNLLADVTYTKWSEIDKVAVVNAATGVTRDILNFHFQDTYRVSIGANYKYSENWTLKGGLAYDQTPVRGADSRTVRLPDNDRTWLAVGAKYKVSNAGAIDLGYAHLFLNDADINFTRGQLTPGTLTVNPGTVSNVNGSYQGSVDILSIQYTQSF
jgi:long-chain fatty acid transport protein